MVKTSELILKLREYLGCTDPRNAYSPVAFFENVPNATGFLQRRTADAVSMELWPSKGFTIHGYELKVSRSDWLRELRDPSKATPVQDYCDHWWLVAGDDTVCPHGCDLPSNWGLLVLREVDGERKLVVSRKAPELKPKPVDRAFVAALARKLYREAG